MGPTKQVIATVFLSFGYIYLQDDAVSPPHVYQTITLPAAIPEYESTPATGLQGDVFAVIPVTDDRLL